MEMTIGKFAAAGQVGVETIRYYQRRGLLATPRRSEGVRHYGDGDVRRLLFIRQAQAAVSPLKRSGTARFGFRRGQRTSPPSCQEPNQCPGHQDRELQRAREALQRLVGECATGKSGPCPILESFEL